MTDIQSREFYYVPPIVEEDPLSPKEHGNVLNFALSRIADRLDQLEGFRADTEAPMLATHASTHEPGGNDAIDFPAAETTWEDYGQGHYLVLYAAMMVHGDTDFWESITLADPGVYNLTPVETPTEDRDVMLFLSIHHSTEMGYRWTYTGAGYYIVETSELGGGAATPTSLGVIAYDGLDT